MPFLGIKQAVITDALVYSGVNAKGDDKSMTQIKHTILQRLREAEEQHQIKIPLAVESGSRGWGLAAYDADYDCRFVYVHTKDWYLSIMDKKDYIDIASDAVYDVNGWDIKKFLIHMMKSNAVVSEWLSSNEVYIRNDAVVKPLQDLAAALFNPIAASYHYLNTAKNKLSEILSAEDAKIKKYFYALRPLANLRYIQQYGKMPPMEYEQTLAAIEIPTEISAAIKELLAIKRQSSEGQLMPRNKQIVRYIQDDIQLIAEQIKEMKFTKSSEYETVDSVFRDTIEKVWHNG